jgi:uncharacterized protein YdeI (YjbR/CyaY-like superfamily)
VPYSFKGALMKDPDQILIQQSENVQAARQIRFTDVQQINDLEKFFGLICLKLLKLKNPELKLK